MLMLHKTSVKAMLPFLLALVNLPLGDVATWVLPPNLMARATVPSHLSGPVIGPTQAEAGGPITKEDWFKASGKLTTVCDSGGNSVSIEMQGMVPNRLYTVWALWLDPSGPRFVPVPFGGVPNVFITDQQGNASFDRALNFCPVEAAESGVDGKRLGLIETHLHSDHVAYGGIPAPLAAGFPPGTTLHGQLLLYSDMV